MAFLFDLARTWWKIVRRGRSGHRLQVLWSYTKLRLAFLPSKLGVAPAWTPERPGRMTLLGYRVELPAFYPCVMLFEELFVDEAYAFDSPQGARRIIDCGAHVGLATLYFAWRHPGAGITAFEPDPQLFGFLRRNVGANGLVQVELHNTAVSGSADPVVFHTQNGYQGGTANSIDVANFRPGTPVRSIVVRATPLSTFLSAPVDLVKLDIEGAEADVIAEIAAAGRLSSVRCLIFEYHHHAGDRLGRVLETLDAAGMEFSIEAEANGAQGAPTDRQLLMVRARRRATAEGPAPEPETVQTA